MFAGDVTKARGQVAMGRLQGGPFKCQAASATATLPTSQCEDCQTTQHLAWVFVEESAISAGLLSILVPWLDARGLGSTVQIERQLRSLPHYALFQAASRTVLQLVIIEPSRNRRLEFVQREPFGYCHFGQNA